MKIRICNSAKWLQNMSQVNIRTALCRRVCCSGLQRMWRWWIAIGPSQGTRTSASLPLPSRTPAKHLRWGSLYLFCRRVRRDRKPCINHLDPCVTLFYVEKTYARIVMTCTFLYFFYFCYYVNYWLINFLSTVGSNNMFTFYLYGSITFTFYQFLAINSVIL